MLTFLSTINIHSFCLNQYGLVVLISTSGVMFRRHQRNVTKTRNWERSKLVRNVSVLQNCFVQSCSWGPTKLTVAQQINVKTACHAPSQTELIE